MSNPIKIKTRMAPSPTGFLHVGTARTTIFNFLFARHMAGEFLLRIEDTDLERSEKRFEENIIEGLKWLGIEWDGEVTRQSERIDLYEKYLKTLLDEGKAFYCPHSEEELELERKTHMEQKISPKHVCSARENLNNDGEIIRFKNDVTNKINFIDEIRGKLSFDPQLFGDFSLAKDTRIPLYNFAVVVDDYEMKISHVIRGEDHISNTPKQILLQEALGFERPKYAHLPLLLGADRSKLSKRHGATSISEYREAGYLSEALFNFLTILGWNPGTPQEIFSKDELIKEFSLVRVQKAGAIFDTQKLDWMNGEYIRQMSTEKLFEESLVFLIKAGLIEQKFNDILKTDVGGYSSGAEIETTYKNKMGNPISIKYIEKIIALEQPRLKKLSELPEKVDYFFTEPEYDAALLKWKNMSNIEIKNSLKLAMNILQIISENTFTKENLEKRFLEKTVNLPAGKVGDRGELLWPLRVALTGRKTSPGPFEIMEILGKDVSISRLFTAISMLK